MERKIREDLRQEWLKKQEELKNEEIEVVYSYWDGSGHRKSVMASKIHLLSRCSCPKTSVQCKKGDGIGSFLEKCRQQFPELRSVSVDNLMYIKVRCFLILMSKTHHLPGGFDHTPRITVSISSMSCSSFILTALYFLRFHRQQSSRQIRSLIQL